MNSLVRQKLWKTMSGGRRRIWKRGGYGKEADMEKRRW